MTLHQLRIFSAVAKNLNISEAAVDLRISQPSVSEQLKLLEEEYRVKLYKKTGRGIKLTEEGRVFLENTERILSQVEKLKRIFSPNARERETRFLTVGGTLGPSASFLPGIASIFTETHPHVELTLRTASSRVMEQLVQNSHVGIAVITTPSASPRLIYEPCRQQEKVFFSSSSRPWAKRQKLSLAEVAGIPLIVFEKEKGRGAANILNQIEGRGFQPKVIMRCETPEAVKTAVKRGMGLGLLYRDHVEPEIQRGDVKIIPVPGLKMHTDSFIIYSKGKPLSADAKDFLALLREEVARLESSSRNPDITSLATWQLTRAPAP